MSKRRSIAFSILLAAAIFGALMIHSETKAANDMPNISGRTRAPAFPAGLSWFNTDRPLTFDGDLKGRVVVMDFWTYCCINCMHVLSELAKVEEHYRGQPVVVIGVHSNKFINEGDAANVREAILRYGIHHPVVVDEGHRIWNEYTVHAWPTLMFIDAGGRVVARLEGESNAATIIGVVDKLLAEGKSNNQLAAGPPALRPEKMVPSMSGLAFPGKILADAGMSGFVVPPSGGIDPSHDFRPPEGGTTNRLFIADSGHNRVIQASLDGKIIAVYGSGEAGLKDGPAKTAQFINPQGMALDSAAGLLFVADTNNHALRQIDLKTGSVSTLAGTGKLGNDRSGGGIGTEQSLNSPWDLALDKNTIYIAMAGTHQLWTYDRATRRASAWAGNGYENINDGALSDASLAQPSGLSLAGGRLYFADSEVSAVRYADLTDGRIHTLIGTGLFNFGDRDGRLDRALVQHPLGVAADSGSVYVADTYNHKIKKIDLAAGKIESIYGGAKELYEPGGLSLANGQLFIADTNHHRIVIMDLASRSTRELALMGWTNDKTAAASKPAGESIAIGPLKSGSEVRLQFEIALPPRTEINALAPMSVRIAPVSGAKLLATQNGALQFTAGKPALPLEIKVPFSNESGEAVYNIEMSFAYCTESDKGLCIPATIRWQAKLSTSATGKTEATINHAL